MNPNDPLDIITADIDDIYLGNLGTVDADLSLPETGKRGTRFIWTSDEHLFLTDDGKVTRPTFGVGDRDITLHLDAYYADEVIGRDYTVTVLQEQPTTVVIAVDDVQVTAFAGADVTLPSVAIAHLSDGSDEVRSVSWGEDGVGRVEGWDTDVHANVDRVFVHPAAGDRNAAQASRDGFVRSRARLAEGTALHRKVMARLEFLLNADTDRMLYNFRQAAGLDTRGAAPMTGWDNPEGNLRGHTTGHFLSALALAWSCTGNTGLLDRIDTMTTALAECQQALHERRGYSWGFLSGYGEEQFDLLERYVTYPTIWAPYYTFDKIVSGLLDCYEYAGSERALDIALKMGFWVNRRLRRLDKAQRDRMWSIYIAGEYGGIISALMRLCRITGNPQFAETAGYFHNDKLLYPMLRNVDTLGGMHANQHIPQIIGAMDTACHAGDLEGLDIARHFWSMVTGHHLYAIGGVGETEMFRAPDAIAGYLTDKSAESCASHNLSKLAMRLFEASPDASYADYYEHVLFNDLVPATHSEPDGGTVYFFPTRPGGRLSFDTDENTCCHGTGLENMFRFEEHIVKGTADTAYMNLYVPADVEACGGAVRLAIRGAGEDAYDVRVAARGDAKLLLRRPGWATSMDVTLNGDPVGTHAAAEPGYLAFDENVTVCEGDVIGVRFGAGLRVIAAPDDPTVAALAYGPYVLAAVSDGTSFIGVPRSVVDSVAAMADRGADAVLAALRDAVGVPFIRVRDIEDERYHIYLRVE